MTALPPTDTQAAAEVGYEHANEGVGNKVLRNGPVPCIMCSKHNLVLRITMLVTYQTVTQKLNTNPKQAQDCSRHKIPPGSECQDK